MFLVGGKERAIVAGGVVGGMRRLRGKVGETNALLNIRGSHDAC
jgi:hypothetical protein